MENLQTLGWHVTEQKLEKTFKFKKFSEAVKFMNHCFVIAEAEKHHPDIHNIYTTVTVLLSTHDAGNTVTEKDTSFAQALEDWLK